MKAISGLHMLSVLLLMVMVFAATTRSSFAQDPFANHIDLKSPADIADATALNSVVQEWHTKSQQCMSQRLATPDECPCYYKSEYTRAKQAYMKAMAKHPNWKGKVLFFRPQGAQSFTNLYTEGMVYQFETRPCR